MLQLQRPMTRNHDEWSQACRQQLESDEPVELSIIDLVLFASECTEDEGELRDIVDGFVQTGRAQLRGLEDGPLTPA